MKFDGKTHKMWICFEIIRTINRLCFQFWLCPGWCSINMKLAIHIHEGPIHIWYKFSLGPSCSFWDISSFLQGLKWKFWVSELRASSQNMTSFACGGNHACAMHFGQPVAWMFWWDHSRASHAWNAVPLVRVCGWVQLQCCISIAAHPLNSSARCVRINAGVALCDFEYVGLASTLCH